MFAPRHRPFCQAALCNVRRSIAAVTLAVVAVLVPTSGTATIPRRTFSAAVLAATGVSAVRFDPLTSNDVVACSTGSLLVARAVETPSWGLDLSGLRTGQWGQESGGIGGLVAVSVEQGGTTNVYLPICDRNGNVLHLVDAASREIAANYEYSPFGVLTGEWGPAKDACPFRFMSKYLDRETGLYYFGRRYYNPASGKWLTRDPLGESGGVNLTAFCRNDPVNKVDPLGLWAWDRDWIETVLYLVAPVNAKGRAAADSFWVESGGAQAKEMLEGVKVIGAGDLGMARQQMIEDTAEQYYRRIMTHQTVSGGDMEDAIVSATGWRMVGADLVGFTELDEARVGLDYTTGAAIEGVERTRRAFMGTGKLAGTVAAVAGTGQSLAAGYRGSGFGCARTPASAHTPVTGSQWYEYFAETYGPENVSWARLPSYAGGKVTGVLRTPVGEVDLLSGYAGPSATMGQGVVPGMNNIIRAHVEGHAASAARQLGVNEAVLYMNKIPCAWETGGCEFMVPRMLGPGRTLRIVVPGQMDKIYTGVAP